MVETLEVSDGAFPGKAALGLLLLVLLAQFPSIHNDFIWDDDKYVTDNLALRDAAGLQAIWTNPGTTPQYYPLTHTSFWIEYQLFGADARRFHATNVLLHALSALLLYLVLRRLGVPCAWLAAALWGVHPIQVESVAWITERKNVLCALFYFASLYCWLTPGKRPTPRIVLLGLLFFVCALLSKTVAATLPVSWAIAVWWRDGRIGVPMRLYGGVMLLGGALLASLTSFLEKHQVGALGAEWSLGLLDRVVLAGRVWWFYLGKLAWPTDFSFIYVRWAVDAGDVVQWLWPLAAAASILGLWHFRERFGRGPLAAMLHYSVALAPALGFFNVYPMRYSWVADHFQYLAGVGPLILVAVALRRVTQFGPAFLGRSFAGRLVAADAGGAPRLAYVAVATIVLGLLTAGSWQRIPALKDRRTLWVDTLARNDAAWIAHNNLGILRAQAGEVDPAREHFLRVIALKPDHAGAHTNLGQLLLRTGHADQALPYLTQAAELDPDDLNTRVLLGDTFLELGNAGRAAGAYRAAAAIEPSEPRVLLGQANVAFREGRFDDAVAGFETLVARITVERRSPVPAGDLPGRGGPGGRGPGRVRGTAGRAPAARPGAPQPGVAAASTGPDRGRRVSPRHRTATGPVALGAPGPSATPRAWPGPSRRAPWRWRASSDGPPRRPGR